MIVETEKIPALALEVGDIGAVKGSGPLGFAARNLFTPYTDRYHHFIVWWKTADGDWVILESINKGLAVGRLSMYAGSDVKFYRATNLDERTRERACEELTEYGRSPYDWLLYLRLAAYVIRTEVGLLRSERRLRRIDASEIPYNADSWLICTEAIVTAYRLVGWSLVPDGVMPLPSAIEQARLDGLIKEVLS